MKRLSLLVGALCFVFASCNNCNTENKDAANSQENPQEEVKKCDKQKESCCKMTEEEKAECKAFKEKWDNWTNLNETDKATLVKDLKTKFDAKEAEMLAKKAECEAKKAKFEEDWKNFDKLTVEEQKALLDQKMECCKKRSGCCKDKKSCNKKDVDKKECPNKK